MIAMKSPPAKSDFSVEVSLTMGVEAKVDGGSVPGRYDAGYAQLDGVWESIYIPLDLEAAVTLA